MKFGFTRTFLALLLVVMLIAGGCVGGGPEEQVPVGEETPDMQVTPEETPTLEQDDAGTGGDISHQAENAHPIDEGVYEGELEEGDDADAYVLKVGKDDILKLELTPDEELDVALLHAATAAAWDSIVPTYGTAGEDSAIAGGKESITIIPNEQSKYYVGANRQGGSGRYSLAVEVDTQDDGGSGGDASWMDSEAVGVEPGTYQGTIGGLDKEDTFAVKLDPGQKVNVTVTPEEDINIGLELAPLEIYQRMQEDLSFKGEAETRSFDFSDESEDFGVGEKIEDFGGVFIIGVEYVGGAYYGNYTVEIEVN